MTEPTDTTIASWISPAAISLTPDDIKSYQDVITHAAGEITALNSSDLVTVAHRIGRPEATAWLTALVQTRKGDFVAVNNDELLARVACCIAVRSLDAGHGPATLVGLFVESAIFTGAISPIGELAEHAKATLATAAAAVRERPTEWTPVATEIASLLGAEQPEGVEATTSDLDVHEKALVRLAEAMDSLAARVDERGKVVDEEYDALWWSYSGRSITTRDPWGDVKPLARRVVLVAHELGQKMSLRPGPPMVRGLLAAALGDQASKKISMADVALAAAAEHVDIAPHAKNRLLPISSAVAQIAELGSDGDTWKDVLERSLGLQVIAETPALDAALQLFREVEIGKFLE